MRDLLTRKVILISGGTQDLGAGVARAAAREGATLVLAGRNAAHGEQVAAELAAGGAEASYVQADVTDVAQAVAAVQTTVRRHGRIDSLVNSAGLTTRGSLLDTTEELLDRHIAVNLGAPFFLMQAAVADMKRRGAPGTIVNIISIDSHGGQSFLAPYVAARAGLAGLTRNAAHAHRWDRIRINGLNMGWSATEGENLTQRQSHGADAALPMGKLGQVDETPTSSRSCSPTAAASSPGPSSTGTRTSSAVRVTEQPPVLRHFSQRRPSCVSV